jgi:hypothetical protein
MPGNSDEHILNMRLKFSVENAEKIAAEIGKQKIQFAEYAKMEDRIRAIETGRLRAEFEMLRLQEIRMWNLRVEAQLLRRQANVIRENAEDIEMIAKPLAAIGATITGSILLAANRYISRAKEINATTDAWHRATTRVEKAQDRIGRVAADTLLPYYERVVNLAEKIAEFIEKNPEVVETGLKVGVGATILGTLGMAVAKGIKLIADFKMQEAANKMLLAAQIMSGAADKNLLASGAGNKFGADVVGKIFGRIGLVFIGLIVAKAAVDGVNEILNRTGIADKIANAQKKIEETSRRPYPGIIARPQAQIALPSPEKSPERFVAAIMGHKLEKEIVAAYENMLEEEKRITEDSAKERLRILEEAAQAEKDLTRSNNQAIAKINANASRAISKTLSDFQKEEQKAFIRYNEQRAEIVRDSGEDILRIEQQLQERLRELNEEHEVRMEELVRSRDALGVVKEQRDFERKRKEEERQSEIEVQQIRRDVAVRLQELSRQFSLERAERLQDLQERLSEIRTQRVEQLREQREHFAAEMRSIKENKARQLRELEIQKNEELRRNREGFLQKIRQLDAALLGELNLRNKYYAKMLVDVDKFLFAYRSRLAGLSSTTPGKASGGYTSGMVRTGEEGVEYILSHRTTKLAEGLLGHSLSQESIINALLKATRGGTTINVSDNRRFDRVPAIWEREEMNRELLLTLQGVFT